MSVFLKQIGNITHSESTVEWKISNILNLSAEKGEYFASPLFRVDNKNFRLRIFPAGSEESLPEFFAVFIANENTDPCCLHFILCLRNSHGTLARVVSGFNVNIVSDWGFSDFYKKSLLRHNNLTILCGLINNRNELQHVLMNEPSDEKREDLEHLHFQGLGELSENLRNIYANKDSCDVILNVRNKELKAHKVILMARSPVFAAMFQHDTIEKQTGFINIPDCDPDTFPLFLEYLYCGYLENISLDTAFQLYCISKKYDVQKLGEVCIEFLIENLTANNLNEILVLADQYDETKLLSGIQEFFNQNFNVIVVTAEWANLLDTNPRLGNKLLIEMSKMNAPQNSPVA